MTILEDRVSDGSSSGTASRAPTLHEVQFLLGFQDSCNCKIAIRPAGPKTWTSVPSFRRKDGACRAPPPLRKATPFSTRPQAGHRFNLRGAQLMGIHCRPRYRAYRLHKDAEPECADVFVADCGAGSGSIEGVAMRGPDCLAVTAEDAIRTF